MATRGVVDAKLNVKCIGATGKIVSWTERALSQAQIQKAINAAKRAYPLEGSISIEPQLPGLDATITWVNGQVFSPQMQLVF